MILWACFFLVFISMQFITPFYIADKYGFQRPQTNVAGGQHRAGLHGDHVITLTQGVLVSDYQAAPANLAAAVRPRFRAGTAGHRVCAEHLHHDLRLLAHRLRLLVCHTGDQRRCEPERGTA